VPESNRKGFEFTQKGAFSLNRKVQITSILAVAALVGSGVSIFALNRSRGHAPSTIPSHAEMTGQTSPSKPQLLTLSQREHNLSTIQSDKYHAIPVLTRAGEHSTLDVSKHPVVFVADWDTSVLREFAGQKFASEPTLVVTWPRSREILLQDMDKVILVAKQLHLSNPVVALDSTRPTQWITGLPDTYVSRNGTVMEVPGTLATDEVTQWTNLFK